MTSRGTQRLWLRGVGAGAACLLALGSSSALVSAAVVGHGPTVILASHGDGNGDGSGDGHGQGHGDGNGNGHGDGNGNGQGSGNGGLGNVIGDVLGSGGGEQHVDSSAFGALQSVKAKIKAMETATRPGAAAKPHGQHPKPATHAAAAPHSDSQPDATAPSAKPVVESSDPAPFSAQAVSATEAARVLPVESLGPLSGISFGSGLFIWPVLVAVDLIALAVIARLALRRRLVPSDD